MIRKHGQLLTKNFCDTIYKYHVPLIKRDLIFEQESLSTEFEGKVIRLSRARIDVLKKAKSLTHTIVYSGVCIQEHQDFLHGMSKTCWVVVIDKTHIYLYVKKVKKE